MNPTDNELDQHRRTFGKGGDSHVAERVVSQLLTEMDGLEDLKGVVVIGATNRPDIIDEALLRPGRFDQLLEIPLADSAARKEILKIHTAKKPLDKTVSLDKLVELTKGYSGADIAALVNAAAMSAIKEYVATNRSGKTKSLPKEVHLKNITLSEKVKSN
jgi:transitional endoplasmic reticulum ATPase